MNTGDLMQTLTKVQNLLGIPDDTREKTSDLIGRMSRTDNGAAADYRSELQSIYSAVAQYVDNQESSEEAIQVKQELGHLVHGYQVTT
ncbi:hypothetical protein RAC89_26160 [Paenibacillus sp. GD4]|jgi:hypothetical protein|uniref:hypothetical protein n=1 Tax=Paenibacillus sp. GD4 TaxID=3068890 RepID=UPI0027965B43|nr:hypothetical protein [Paenibacillus sp. GD4]MDQ1913890.1 hypothetical protein [Paenibacillus sp. GD4]